LLYDKEEDSKSKKFAGLLKYKGALRKNKTFEGIEGTEGTSSMRI
jgi:hypothetical protein